MKKSEKNWWASAKILLARLSNEYVKNKPSQTLNIKAFDLNT